VTDSSNRRLFNMSAYSDHKSIGIFISQAFSIGG